MTIKDKITRTETQALRGIAILGIMLHNYIHWLGPMVKENEYQFYRMNTDRLATEMADPSTLLPAHLISFFGHYGVQIFVFLSAFGLVMKYENSKADCQAWSFVKGHYLKLWQMMIIGYAAFVMVDYMTPGHWHYTLASIFGQLGMFGNLYTKPNYDIWPGQFWYFGLMVQLYLLYRFVFYPGKNSLSGMLSPKGRNVLLGVLAVASIIPEWFMDPEGWTINWYRYNVFGHIMTFAAGLYFARSMKVDFPRWHMALACLLSMAIIVIGSFDFIAWTLLPIIVCVAAVTFIKVLPQRLLQPLAWVGGISAAIFVSHTIARKIIIPISRGGEIYEGLILYTVCALVLGLIFSKILKLMHNA